MLQIQPLSQTTLQEACKLQHKYLYPKDEYEKQTLHASLDKEHFLEVYKKSYIRTMNYWVGVVDGKVIGLIGIYEEPSDNSTTCWLGWFVVAKEFRHLGYGKQLLEFAINVTKEQNKHTLKLYCYNSHEFGKALTLYEKFGFSVYKTRKKEIFLQKDLKA